MSKKRNRYIFTALCLMCLLLTACKKEKEELPEYRYQVFYVNHDNSGVVSREYVTNSTAPEEVLTQLLDQLGRVSEKLEYNAPLAGSFSLLDYSVKDGQLQLNFDEKYKEQEVITEILTRAAIVRTMSQVKGIRYVSFLVDSQPLLDASGGVVGVMNADSFIENAGKEINTYEKARLRLYFATAEGNSLTAVTRTKVYNSNIAMEKLIVEELLAGPMDGDTGAAEGGAHPVINPNTKVLSVTVRDGICYINLDSNFTSQTYNVTPEAAVYALTNSLVELPNVNKVQISIKGETNISYGETLSLSTMFERNLDLVK